MYSMKIGYGSVRQVDALRYDLKTNDYTTVYFYDVTQTKYEIKIDDKLQKLLRNGKNIRLFMGIDHSQPNEPFIEFL